MLCPINTGRRGFLDFPLGRLERCHQAVKNPADKQPIPSIIFKVCQNIRDGVDNLKPGKSHCNAHGISALHYIKDTGLPFELKRDQVDLLDILKPRGNLIQDALRLQLSAV